MGTLVHLGGEPPRKPKEAPKKKGASAGLSAGGGLLESLPLSPTTIGIGLGALVLVAGVLWFVMGRGGGEATAASPGNPSAAAPAAVPPGAPPGSTTAAGYQPAAAPSGAPAGAAPADTGASGTVQPPADNLGTPPPPSMSGSGSGGASVSTTNATPAVAGAPVMPDAKGSYQPADQGSPFRRQPDGQVIDLRDPPGKY